MRTSRGAPTTLPAAPVFKLEGVLHPLPNSGGIEVIPRSNGRLQSSASSLLTSLLRFQGLVGGVVEIVVVVTAAPRQTPHSQRLPGVKTLRGRLLDFSGTLFIEQHSLISSLSPYRDYEVIIEVALVSGSEAEDSNGDGGVLTALGVRRLNF